MSTNAKTTFNYEGKQITVPFDVFVAYQHAAHFGDEDDAHAIIAAAMAASPKP